MSSEDMAQADARLGQIGTNFQLFRKDASDRRNSERSDSMLNVTPFGSETAWKTLCMRRDAKVSWRHPLKK